jgi:hypothetical protein
MAQEFMTYMGKPLVRSKNEIYYGDMAESHVVKFTILSFDENDEPTKINVQLLKSNTELADKDRIVKESTKSTMYEALDVGFVWLERTLK